MNKTVFTLVAALAVFFAYVSPSAAQLPENNRELLDKDVSATAKFISKEYGGDFAKYSRKQRLQGFQMDIRPFGGSHWNVITHASYSQGSQSGVKSWVFDASAKALIHTYVSPHVKFFTGPSIGVLRVRANRVNAAAYKETELAWGVHTGAELSQGSLSWIVAGSYRFIDDFGKGAAVATNVNLGFTERISLNVGVGYDWNSDAVTFNSGLGLRLN